MPKRPTNEKYILQGDLDIIKRWGDSMSRPDKRGKEKKGEDKKELFEKKLLDELVRTEPS